VTSPPPPPRHRPPGFRELTLFTIVTYGLLALREGVTAPRRSTPTGGGAGGSDRTLLLECRLEQLRGALDEARAEADQARIRLAEAAAREAGETQRLSVVQDEVARARAEVAALHRRLEQSEALRAKLQGHLFESDGRDDAHELVRLRREVAAAHERIAAGEQTASQLRARVDELVASRETLLTRVVEWQRAVRDGDTEAVDLAEFIASLRRAVLDLERDNALGESREAALREQLEQATTPAATPEPPQPPQPPADDLVAALAAAKHPQDQVELLLRLGRRGGDDAFYAVRPWATAEDPNVRAAAYQSLGRLLERDPARLEPHVRWGIADANPYVRRRVVLAAAAARGLALRPLLEPLSGDPDPQVRRIVHRILRAQVPQRTEAGIVQRAS
jgi:HEAT repeat protein